ncbi:MAG: cytochrome c oxidase subunit 3 [Acidimicrobiia bacterium]|nr:cytochrome c oxidase subunit 3 [Acidimicrobiia bacterium]
MSVVAPAVVTDVIPADAPAADPARPRLVLIGTALTIVAFAMVFTGLFATYFLQRAEFGPGWIPDGAGTIPLSPASVMLVTLAMSAITVQWVKWAIANDDRLNTYLSAGFTLVLAVAFLNQASFLYTAMGWEVGGEHAVQAVLIYAITGAQILMLVAAMVFLVLMSLRALAGQYTARDHEGLTAAVLFWHAAVVAYAVIWAAIYNVK